MAKKFVKRFSTSLATKRMQIKTTLKFHPSQNGYHQEHRNSKFSGDDADENLN